MTCPQCGGMSEVLRSVKRHGGTAIARRRQCLKRACKHRWTTIEHEATKVVAYVPRHR